MPPAPRSDARTLALASPRNPVSPLALLTLLTLLVLLIVLGRPALAGGPLDLADTTPRTVLVSVDQDVSDYGQIGGAYSLPVEAGFTSAGGVATLSVAGSAVEDLVTAVFSGLASAVPGSFTDYVVTIDTTSREVLSASVSGQISSPVGNLAVQQTASSTMTAGYELQDILGAELPVFCTAGASCTIVPGAPFDPSTGTANAVGVIDAGLVKAFSPFGDLKITEKGIVDCEISLDMAGYSTGDPILASLSVVNNDTVARAVELKVWLEIPGNELFSVFNIGADFGLVIEPGDSIGFAATRMFTPDDATPRGQWALGCRALDVVKGEVFDSGLAPFDIQ